VNLIDVNDNAPTFPLSQYIVQGIPETIGRGSDIIQGSAVAQDPQQYSAFLLFLCFFVLNNIKLSSDIKMCTSATEDVL